MSALTFVLLAINLQRIDVCFICSQIYTMMNSSLSMKFSLLYTCNIFSLYFLELNIEVVKVYSIK